MSKKIALILISSLLFLNSLIMPFATALAADEAPSTWYNQDFKSWLEKVDDSSNPSEIFGERYTSAQVQWIIYGLISFLLHTNLPSDVVSCVFSNSIDLSACKDSIQRFLTSESVPATAFVLQDQNKNLVSLIFASDRPLSGISYLKGKVSKLGFIPTTYAQGTGFGFGALEPIQEMWKASRDVAFGLFVLTAIIFAFMIMFRVKISPQIVISVQSSLPKLISALILVTFSYAIAGFLIDFMYVVIGLFSVLIASFMGNIWTTPSSTAVFSMLTQGNFFGVFGINIQTGVFGLIGLYLAPLLLGLLILTLVVGALSVGIFIWIPIIILLIVMIVGLWITVKTIWALLKAFVNILLLTIFAPFQLALGVLIPSFGFGAWVKNYLANLSVFVVTGVIWSFSMIFLIQGWYIGLKDVGGEVLLSAIFPALGVIKLAADQVANYTTFPPLLGFGGNKGVGLLFLGVSFVLFTLIPKATEIIQGFISGKPFAYGSAIGEAFGPIKLGAGAYSGRQLDILEAKAKRDNGKSGWEYANSTGQTGNYIFNKLLQFLNTRRG